MKGQFVLTKEAGRILDLAPNSVRVMERRGELPAERVGGVRIFERVMVERMAKARAAASRGRR